MMKGRSNLGSSKVVIIGGGIHGVSIAYYLGTQFNVKPLIIEQTQVACAASGKAGGFLARHWGFGPTIQLHEKSYDLHKQLAQQLNIESFREITTLSVDGNRKGKNIAKWLNRKVTSKVMDDGTAQVTPLEFTDKLLAAAKEAGTELLIDSVTGITIENDEVKGVQCEKSGMIEAENVIIAMGPWSGVALEDWFKVPLPMQGVKSTSLVFNRVPDIIDEPYAAFCEEDEWECHLELYPRPNGDLYICGCGGSDYIEGDRLRKGGDAADATLIQANPQRVLAATSSLRSMSSLGDQAPDLTQACLRPCTSDALPVMGRIPGVKGGFISAGHNCWGILWAPVSGLAMAELVATGTCNTVDLAPFDVQRFMTEKSQRGRKKGAMIVGEQW